MRIQSAEVNKTQSATRRTKRKPPVPEGVAIVRTARKPFSGSFWSCIETSNGKAYFAEDTYDQAAAKAKAAVMAQVFDAVIYV